MSQQTTAAQPAQQSPQSQASSSLPNTCELRLEVVEGRGLPNDRSGTCNPYVVLHFNQGEKRKSPNLKHTSSPVWNRQISLPIKLSVRPVLVDVVVKSLPPAPYSSELLGCVTLDLLRPISPDAWHTLGDLPGRTPPPPGSAPRQPNGQIRLRAEIRWPDSGSMLVGPGAASNCVPPGAQYLRGILKKQKPGGGPWKLRWFVQFEDSLCYFEPGKTLADGLKGRIELKQVTAVVSGPESDFLVHTASRVFTLRAPDRQCKEYWMRGLTLLKRHFVSASARRETVPEEPSPCPYRDPSSNNFLLPTAVPGICYLAADGAKPQVQAQTAGDPAFWEIKAEDSLSEDACYSTSSPMAVRTTTVVPVSQPLVVGSWEKGRISPASPGGWCTGKISVLPPKESPGKQASGTPVGSVPQVLRQQESGHRLSVSELDVTEFIDISVGTPESLQKQSFPLLPSGTQDKTAIPRHQQQLQHHAQSSSSSSSVFSFSMAPASPDTVRRDDSAQTLPPSSGSWNRVPARRQADDDEYGEKTVSPPVAVSLSPPPSNMARLSPRSSETVISPPPPKSPAPAWPVGFGQPAAGMSAPGVASSPRSQQPRSPPSPGASASISPTLPPPVVSVVATSDEYGPVDMPSSITSPPPLYNHNQSQQRTSPSPPITSALRSSATQLPSAWKKAEVARPPPQ